MERRSSISGMRGVKISTIVLKILKKLLKKRDDLRRCPLVIFTAQGEGPAKAYSKLAEFAPKIVAVTFPRTFRVKRGEEWLHPQISPGIRKFFNGVGIEVVVPHTLPFDPIEGLEAHNHEVKMIKDIFSVFEGGFSLCIQAVLRACDASHIQPGEQVIAISGDVAALVTASTTDRFLNKTEGVSVLEIFCKPSKLTIVRPGVTGPSVLEGLVPSGI